MMEVSLVRQAAYEALWRVERDHGFANLVLKQVIGDFDLDPRQAATCTEYVNGTTRFMGTYDQIIALAAERKVQSLEPAVLPVLRLACHELLSMRTPNHAAVDEAVNLARGVVGQRVTGLVNAITRRIGRQSLDEWAATLAEHYPNADPAIFTTHHPGWIVKCYRNLLGDEAEAALEANNVVATPTLVVRPTLLDRDTLVRHTAGATPTKWSPHGLVLPGNPGRLVEVREGTAGVQDEGSQLVAEVLAHAAASRRIIPSGRRDWLDLCAGPGGKAALLTGLMRQSSQDSTLLANEVSPHRADLVQNTLRAYPDQWQVICRDGTDPGLPEASFDVVMADVPCTGLGALRRRPDARWRHNANDLAELTRLQAQLLDSAWSLLQPGGVLAYVTCSPHPEETTAQLEAFAQRTPEALLLNAPVLLADLTGDRSLADPASPTSAVHPLARQCIQLWPHRHGTDAMFCALFGRSQPAR